MPTWGKASKSASITLQMLDVNAWHARCACRGQNDSSTNLQDRVLEDVMETMDQIYLWKRLYWQAVGNGCEPGEAERFANRSLPWQQRTSHRATPTARISATYATVAA